MTENDRRFKEAAWPGGMPSTPYGHVWMRVRNEDAYECDRCGDRVTGLEIAKSSEPERLASGMCSLLKQ
jgi:hypothetical protein